MAVDTKGGRFTQAQASLLSALEFLLSEKSLASIDVKRLCEHAHVARTTFYVILEVASSAVIAAYVYWLKNPSAVSKGDVFSMIELALGVMPTAVR